MDEVLSRGAHRIGLGVVLAAYLALAACYNLAVPIFEAPDEIWHYLYVRHLSEGGGLPRDEGRKQGLLAQQEAAQPPLYYVVAAGLTFWAPRGDLSRLARRNRVGALGTASGHGNRNLFLHGPNEAFPWSGEALTIHLVRLTTTLWGALAVLCAYLIGRRVSRSPWLAVAAAAVVAFNPEFLFMSAAVNNDVAVAGAMGLLLLLAIQVAESKPALRRSFLLGVVAGAVILVKPLAAGGLPIALLAVGFAGWREQLGYRTLARHLGVALGGTIPACGWWFVFNQLTYGSPVPLQSFLSRDNLLAESPSVRQFINGLPGLFYSFWAVFGWFSIVVPEPFYQYVQAVVGVAALGLVLLAGRSLRRSGPGALRIDGVALGIVTLGAFSIVGAVFAYRLIVSAFHGRLLFGGITGFAVLFVLGWSVWLPRRWGIALALAAAATLAWPAASFPWTVIRPAYAPPAVLASSDVHPMLRFDRRFGAEVALRGVDLDPKPDSRLRPGDQITVTLYLEALQPIQKDYLLFVKLVDPSLNALAGADSHPGQGSLPTSSWQPGTVVVDRYQFQVPENASGPAVDQILLGFFPEENNLESLPVFGADNQPAGKAVVLGSMVVPGPEDLELSQRGRPFRVGDSPALTLVQSRIASREATAGGTLDGTLVFGTLRQMPLNYTIFLHLEGPDGILCQDDAQPRHGGFPTGYWRPGDIIQHDWHLRLPADARAGEYRLTTGWYDLQSGQRLSTEDGNSIDLGRVVVH